jgi:hypothetical protein
VDRIAYAAGDCDGGGLMRRVCYDFHIVGVKVVVCDG